MLAACVGGTQAASQAPTTFRSGTELVVMQVSVVDGRGHFVPGLERDDFSVFEEGAPQTVALFGSAEATLDLMLLLDTSASMHARMAATREAAVNFIRTLRRGDRASVVLFSDTVRIAHPLSGDTAALEKVIRAASAAGGTALNDAIYFALRELARVQPGEEAPRRRALVVFSDGDDNTSRLTSDHVLEEARRSAVTAFTIVPGEPASAAVGLPIRERPVSPFNLRQIAEATGGRSFSLTRIEDLAGVYGEIAAELGGQYWLAYVPTSSIGGFRRISVKVVTQPGLRARTRSGYHTPCWDRIHARSVCR